MQIRNDGKGQQNIDVHLGESDQCENRKTDQQALIVLHWATNFLIALLGMIGIVMVAAIGLAGIMALGRVLVQALQVP